jgi:uracil-DNA glycosylase
MPQMLNENFALESSWKIRLLNEFSKPYIQKLRKFLNAEKGSGKKIFPPDSDIFAALDACPFEKVRVVILGQDPYHGARQAHGLCFSVRKGVPLPPSLKNIFKELQSDCSVTPPDNGDLTPWARQGVLMLNTILTVESGKPESHRGKGWEQLTEKILQMLNSEREGLVFVLWGSNAQAKASLIDASRHLILKAPHPSPLSAYRGFFGCGHFSKINAWLEDLGHRPINWSFSKSRH